MITHPIPTQMRWLDLILELQTVANRIKHILICLVLLYIIEIYNNSFNTNSNEMVGPDSETANYDKQNKIYFDMFDLVYIIQYLQ